MYSFSEHLARERHEALLREAERARRVAAVKRANAVSVDAEREDPCAPPSRWSLTRLMARA